MKSLSGYYIAIVNSVPCIVLEGSNSRFSCVLYERTFPVKCGLIRRSNTLRTLFVGFNLSKGFAIQCQRRWVVLAFEWPILDRPQLASIV